MLPSGLQVYFRSRVTLTFDLMTPQFVVLLCRCPPNARGPLVPIGSSSAVAKRPRDAS